MTVEAKKQYTAEFKREAVALVTEQGYTLSGAARNLGINRDMLRRWKRQIEKQEGRISGKRAPNTGASRTAPVTGRDSAPPDGARYFKKSDGVLRHRVEMRYRLIHREKRSYPLTVLCQVLQVSRSGYYAFVKRELRTSQVGLDPVLLAEVRRLHLESRRTYGQRRLCVALRVIGFVVGRRRTRTLMQQAGVSVRRRRPWRPRTTDSQHPWPVAPNRLNRQFAVAGPNRVWASDLTYIPTHEGWLYLALVVDLFSGRWSAGPSRARGRRCW